MVKRILISATVVLILSCSNRPVMVGSDAGDEINGRDTDTADIRSDRDIRDNEDVYIDPSEPSGDIPSDEDTFETALVDCTIPVRDCGPGCRQVTCAASVWDPVLWNIHKSVIAYFTVSSDHTAVLYKKNLETNEEARLKEYLYGEQPLGWDSFANYEDKLAYIIYTLGESPPCKTALRLFDLDTEVDEILVCDHDGEVNSGLDMYSNTIVWAGGGRETFESDLFILDLSTMEKTRLTEWQMAFNPRLWGRQFVFEMSGVSHRDVFLWDLDAMNYRNLTENPSAQWSPDIWENRVVWVDHRNDPPGSHISPHNCDIYWCDLPDCVPFPATTNWASQEMPTVEGDWIAWIDYRNDINPLNPASSYHDNLEIWGYNISTGEEYQLASEDTTLWWRLAIENGKLYYLAAAEPMVSGAIFEIDLSQFL